ncbi:hypothetical protein Bbelb_221830 [Branchiostoma belcheri]|nr:hypothetical protein Bbelb_221830 [Branchiostoma belcheri]
MRKPLRKLRMASCLHLCAARQTSEEYPAPRTSEECPARRADGKGRVSVIEEAAKLLDRVFAKTDFEDKDDAQQTFAHVRSELPKTAASPDGVKLVQKFASLGSAATAESTFLDMIKIIWRTVRLTPGTSVVRIQLFFLAIAGMMVSVLKSPSVSDGDSPSTHLKTPECSLRLAGSPVIHEAGCKQVRLTFLPCQQPGESCVEDESLLQNKQHCRHGDVIATAAAVRKHLRTNKLKCFHLSICHGNLLDLVFSNFPESLSAINEVPTVFDTDHAILEFMIKCKSQPKRGISRKVFNFKAADWEGLRSDQSLSDLEEEMGKHSDIDSAWQTWRSTVQAAMVKYIPSRQLKNSSTPPWVDSEVRHVRHKKYTAWKKAKRTDKPVHWAKFRKLRNKLKNILSSKYRNFLDGLSSSLQESPKRFWSFVRAKAKAKSLPSVVKNDGSIAQSAKEKANIFNQYFYSTFSPVDRNTSKPDIDIVSVDALSNLQFSVDVVQDVLASLDITKAVGPDNISPLILRKCADILAPSLTQLFNKSTTFVRCKTSTFATSYIPRLVAEWNRLEVRVRDMGAVASGQSELLTFKRDLLETWLQKVEVWLGRQLTSGGKGCVDGGEGSVNDRIDRFFSTPYLHDFD